MKNTHRVAADLSMKVLAAAYDAVKIGVTGIEVNKVVGQKCKELGVTPAFYGVGNKSNPFPANLCVSVNNNVLHAIPDNRPFQAGDLVKLDLGIVYKGFYTDHCVTIGLQPVAEQDKKLIQIGKLAVEAAVERAGPKARTGDLGYAMQSVAELAGFNVLKNYVGHGIGQSLWQAPEIPAYGDPGTGSKLKPGSVICVEAQVVAGRDHTKIAADGWGVATVDNTKGVMFEYMLHITKNGREVLTDTRNWKIFK